MSSRWRSRSSSEGGRGNAALPLALFLAFAAAAAGCTAFDVFTSPKAKEPPAAAKARKPAPAPVGWMPPAPPSRVAFNHKFHLGAGVTCADCHEGTETADKAPMPTVEFCMNCHEDIDANKADAKDRTVAGFLAPDGTPKWSNVTAQSPDIVFSHKAHLAKKLECADCHKAVETSEKVSPALFLDMDACTKCHEAKQAKNECATCHKAAAKSVAEGKGQFWAPANHGAAWRADHGHVTHLPAPRIRAERCDDCHGKTGFPQKGDCATCHAATKPTSHDAAWRGVHGADALADLASVSERCGTCHDSAVFPAGGTCATCHAVTKPANHEHLWRDLHGQAVRRDAASVNGKCAFCHEAAGFPAEARCSGCHETVEPRDHSESWRVGGGHGLSASMDRARCAACHTSDTCAACHATVEPRSHRGNWGAPRNRHCVNCHLPLSETSPEGCAVCHQGTPSHSSAPPMPSEPPHRPDMTCRKCHDAPPNLRHADNGTNCVKCHR